MKIKRTVYIPLYSMLQWKVTAGEYEWICFSWESQSKTPDEIAFTFSWNFKNKISTLCDLKNIIKSISEKTDIYHDDFPTAVASKTKKYIDSYFSSSFEFAETAKHLKIPQSTLTHYFKKSFRLSPVEYRKRLRTAEFLRLMIGNKQKNHQVFANTGFEDYSRFYRNIKTTHGASPKERVDINSKPQEKLCAKLKIKEFFQGRNSNRPIESYTFKDAKVAPNHAIDWLPPLQLSNNYEKI